MNYEEQVQIEKKQKMVAGTQSRNMKERRINKELVRERVFHCRKCGATYMKDASGCPLCEAEKRNL